MHKPGFAIVVMMLLLSATSGLASSLPKADLVLVSKSESKLYLVKGGRWYRKYHVALGKNPVGHKLEVGDRRTPEGSYVLDYKRQNSAFYKAIHISYPNDTDRLMAESRGVDPGGQIMIHGQPNNPVWPESKLQQFNWTEGCIAVRNKEMDEIWMAVEPGTPIEIIP
ncbi:MAG: L,D-transpeptidase family protein [Hahellaceae bacterium]|nr:L,D-transpeptidase family protein [Hahellaceae bacterium]MCP5168969.1 L,D-transpeptidase family protein [Hahellaceae bacterium]